LFTAKCDTVNLIDANRHVNMMESRLESPSEKDLLPILTFMINSVNLPV